MSSNLWMAIFAYNSLSTLIPLTHTTLPPFDNSIHRHKSVPVQLSMNYRSPFLSSNPFPLENFATSFEKFESPRKSIESSFFDRQPIWTYSSLETVILNLFLVEKGPIKVLSSGQRITLWTNYHRDYCIDLPLFNWMLVNRRKIVSFYEIPCRAEIYWEI